MEPLKNVHLKTQKTEKEWKEKVQRQQEDYKKIW